MLGIGGGELLVILIVAIALIPAKRLPDVISFVARTVRGLRRLAGKIQDGVDNLEDEIAKDLPVDSLSQKTMDDMIETFSSPVKPRAGKKRKK